MPNTFRLSTLETMMKSFFGGGESSKDDDDKEKKQSGGSRTDGVPGAVSVVPEPEPDIPLITDAVVVHNEEEYSKPPPSNPECLTRVNSPPASPGSLPANNMVIPYQPAQLTHPNSIYYNLGRSPVGLQCPHCHRQTITVVQDRMGLGTLVAVLLLALFFWPLCWLPLCIPSCKTTNHYCGHFECRRRVGETSPCA